MSEDHVPAEWMVPTKKNEGGRPKGATEYSANQIDQALLAMAFTGSAREAREQITHLGWHRLPTENTLRLWKRKYAARYVELYDEHKDKIDDVLVAEYGDAIRQAVAGVVEGIALTREQIKKKTIRDAAGATRNLATTAAIFQDKSNLIRGKPTSIVGNKAGSEALHSLAKKFGVDVDSTATEEPNTSPKVIQQAERLDS